MLESRWRSASGEVDLICLDPRGVLVGVEVKLRRTSRTGHGAEALTARRVARLRGTLVDYARQRRCGTSALRIDLVSLTPAGARWRLVWTPGIDAW